MPSGSILGPPTDWNCPTESDPDSHLEEGPRDWGPTGVGQFGSALYLAKKEMEERHP